MARTGMGPWKLVLAKGSSIHPGWFMPKMTCLDLLFVLFVALRPKSTAMVIAGRSVHLTTLFPGQA